MDNELVVYDGYCVYNISDTKATFLIEYRDGTQHQITIPTFQIVNGMNYHPVYQNNLNKESDVSDYQCLQDNIAASKKAFKELPISITQVSTTIVLVNKENKRYGVGIVPGIVIKLIK